MKLLRTLSTGSLIILAAVVVLAAGGTAIALAAGGGGPTPPAKPLAQAIHDGLAAPEPAGVTARIKFTNRLFPSGAFGEGVGSALISGASGRLWLRNDGRGRLELQSTAGDVQIVWNAKKVSVYDASSNTVYRANLPARKTDRTERGAPPSLAKIQDFLSELGQHAAVSSARPTNLAGRPAYGVSLSPKKNGGLLGSLRLAWDAARGVPLRAAVYARGSSKPVLALEATNIDYGPVPARNVEIAPPADASTTQLSAPSKDAQRQQGHARRSAGFPVVAPDTLAGLARTEVRVVGGADSKTVLVVYGEGLGAIIVAEHKADAAGGRLGSLPKVPLGGVQGNELATPLGTVIEWRRASVEYVLAGSMQSSAAEAAARALR